MRRILSMLTPAALAKEGLEPTAVIAVPVLVCIANVIIGTFLYQGLVTMTPTVINSLIHLDISEIIRIIVSNGMIVYALTRKMGGKK